MPVPDPSGRAGQPLVAHRAAISATIVGSVTRSGCRQRSSTSKPCVATADRCTAGSRATFVGLPRASRRSGTSTEPACHSAPTLVTCGLPSASQRRQPERRAIQRARGSSCAKRSASCVSTQRPLVADVNRSGARGSGRSGAAELDGTGSTRLHVDRRNATRRADLVRMERHGAGVRQPDERAEGRCAP